MIDSAIDAQTTLTYQLDLPPFPSTATRLVAALNDPTTHIRDIIALIECEPKISSCVLNLSNSPLYGATRSITSIGHAVVILGFKSVSNLALTAATGSLFAAGDSDLSVARDETYFQSLAIGTLARLFARQVDAANPDEAFLTGVMHDVGKLVLLDAGGHDYASIISSDDLGDTVEKERQLFGTSHPELGGKCGQKWGLPPSIVTAIANHHHKLVEVADVASNALIAANYAARNWSIGFAEELDVPRDPELDQYINALGDSDLPQKSAEQYAALREICA